MNNSNLFFIAWSIKAQNQRIPFSTCLKKAWENKKLISRMENEIVEFVFTKSDGSIRIAEGTRMNFKNNDKSIKDRSIKQRGAIAFFDTKVNQIRSFRAISLNATF